MPFLADVALDYRPASHIPWRVRRDLMDTVTFWRDEILADHEV